MLQLDFQLSIHRNTEFTFSSKLECPECKKTVHVGTGGYKNLNAHHTSKACQTCAKANKTFKPDRPNQSLDMFLKPQVSLNSSMISAPSPVHPTEVRAKGLTSEFWGMPATTDDGDKTKDMSMPESKNAPLKCAPNVCQKGIQLL